MNGCHGGITWASPPYLLLPSPLFPFLLHQLVHSQREEQEEAEKKKEEDQAQKEEE